jgi:hypothetical protein
MVFMSLDSSSLLVNIIRSIRRFDFSFRSVMAGSYAPIVNPFHLLFFFKIWCSLHLSFYLFQQSVGCLEHEHKTTIIVIILEKGDPQIYFFVAI